MPNLHDLAIIIGNSSGMVILSALAAGLAAFALLAGISKVARAALPNDYPVDGDARLDKYVLAFQQLELAGKGSPADIARLAAQMKNQPAAQLALTAFQKYAAVTTPPGTGKNVGTAATIPPQQAKAARNSSSNAFKPTKAIPDHEGNGEEDFPKTVDVSRPNRPSQRRTKH